MITSTQLRTHANNADAFEAINHGQRTLGITYADLAAIDRLAAQLLDDDDAGEITLTAWPEATALVELARRIHTR